MVAVLWNFLYFVVFALWILMIIRAIMSWFTPRGGGGMVAFVYQVTEPIVAPIRRILPATGGFDFSLLVAMLLLGMLVRLLRPM